MEIRFRDAKLDRLETDLGFTAGLSRDLLKAYRKRLGQIRGAADERDMRALKALRYKKLSGSRSHQHSLRLNDQWRLIVEREDNEGEKVIAVVAIEDYH